MRVRIRRNSVYILSAVLGFMFLFTLHHNTYRLSTLELEIIDDSHEFMQRDISKSEDEDRRKKHVINPVSQASIGHRRGNIWEAGIDRWNDRIQMQLEYIPRSYSVNSSAFKVILAPDGISDTPPGQKKFLDDGCLVNRCHLTTSMENPSDSDAVLVQNGMAAEFVPRSSRQIWILWLLESPINSIGLDWLNEKGINWTATFRSDSTIVTPYERFVPYVNSLTSSKKLGETHDRNFARNKSKLVAWFVSNCVAANQRLEYATELRKYIQVDIYGACGGSRCARGNTGNRCDHMLKSDYKFYLSFENSNCEYYITEKLFWNALLNNVVPVVMGARTSDYLHAAPPGSYIHVEDYKTPQQLAQYLLKLDKDDVSYNKYFEWKSMGEFTNTKFWCRLCAMLHDSSKPVLWVQDVVSWWRANDSCTRNRWDSANDLIRDWKLFEE